MARIKNVSEHPVAYAAWSLPVLRPGGRAFVPLDKGPLTAFDAIRKLILWSYAEPGDPRYGLGDQLIEIDSGKVQPAPPAQAGRRDDESKIGVDSTQGWGLSSVQPLESTGVFRFSVISPFDSAHRWHSQDWRTAE